MMGFIGRHQWSYWIKIHMYVATQITTLRSVLKASPTTQWLRRGPLNIIGLEGEAEGSRGDHGVMIANGGAPRL